MPRGRARGYEEQREQILARAAALFARNGYTATSMNDVAEACGVSKPSLYHYVRDKHQLLVEIAEGHIARLLSLLEAADASAGRLAPEVHLRQLIAAFLDVYARSQAEHRVLTEDVRFLQPAERKRVLGGERKVVAAFADAIAAARPEMQRGGLEKPLAMLLFGMMNWMFTWLQPGGALTHAAMAPVVADLFFGGLGAVRPPVAFLSSPHDGDKTCRTSHAAAAALSETPRSPPASPPRPRSAASRRPTSPSA